jgi:hypothetical protein
MQYIIPALPGADHIAEASHGLALGQVLAYHAVELNGVD